MTKIKQTKGSIRNDKKNVRNPKNYNYHLNEKKFPRFTYPEEE